MKKYIIMATAIALFSVTQLISMDRNPSAEDIRAFKNFLASKLATIQNSILLYRGTTEMPIVHANLLINLQTHVRDMAAKHHIDRITAANIFHALTKESVIQALALRYPKKNATEIQNLYDLFCADSIGIVTNHIFDN
jgi:hypothetical protein